MHIVIDIPDGIYKAICDSKELTHATHIAIKEGTPLPKGHGRIGDLDRLYTVFEKNVVSADAFKELFDQAPTIIEADKEKKMAKLPTHEEMVKKVAEEVFDEYVYKGKTLRKWIDILTKTQWIPCSERLPEQSGEYLVTVYCTKYITFVDKFDYTPTSDGWVDPETAVDWNDYVVAWMPLPKPWKGEK